MAHTLTLDACVESFIVDDIFSPEVMERALTPGVAPPADGPSAAVAAVIRTGLSGAEMLFIERSSKEGDPWSGQMAFPGGRTAASDEHSLATAVRETKEELDLDLSDSQLLGRRSDLEGGPRGPRQRLRVTPHLFWLKGERPVVTPNHEVAAAVWVPVTDLLDDARYIQYPYPALGADLWPGIAVEGNRVIWGLTLRMLIDLFERLDRPLTIGL